MNVHQLDPFLSIINYNRASECERQHCTVHASNHAEASLQSISFFSTKKSRYNSFLSRFTFQHVIRRRINERKMKKYFPVYRSISSHLHHNSIENQKKIVELEFSSIERLDVTRQHFPDFLARYNFFFSCFEN